MCIVTFADGRQTGIYFSIVDKTAWRESRFCSEETFALTVILLIPQSHFAISGYGKKLETYDELFRAIKSAC